MENTNSNIYTTTNSNIFEGKKLQKNSSIFSHLDEILEKYSINNFNKNQNLNPNSEILHVLSNEILNRKLKSMKILSMFNENNFEKFVQELQVKTRKNIENLKNFSTLRYIGKQDRHHLQRD